MLQLGERPMSRAWQERRAPNIPRMAPLSTRATPADPRPPSSCGCTGKIHSITANLPLFPLSVYLFLHAHPCFSACIAAFVPFLVHAQDQIIAVVQDTVLSEIASEWLFPRQDRLFRRASFCTYRTVTSFIRPPPRKCLATHRAALGPGMR